MGLPPYPFLRFGSLPFHASSSFQELQGGFLFFFATPPLGRPASPFPFHPGAVPDNARPSPRTFRGVWLFFVSTECSFLPFPTTTFSPRLFARSYRPPPRHFPAATSTPGSEQPLSPFRRSFFFFLSHPVLHELDFPFIFMDRHSTPNEVTVRSRAA